MSMHVMNGYFNTFKVIQGHILGLMSCQGQTIKQNVYSVIYHRYAKYNKDKPNGYWNITGKDKLCGFISGCTSLANE